MTWKMEGYLVEGIRNHILDSLESVWSAKLMVVVLGNVSMEEVFEHLI